MKKFIKHFAILGLLVLALAFSAACRGDNGDANQPEATPEQPAPPAATPDPTPDPDPEDDEVVLGRPGGLPRYVEGELTIMFWSGDGVLRRDVGNVFYDPEEVISRHAGAAIATAQMFNQMYPNVVINVMGTPGGHTLEGVGWVDQRYNFYLEHGLQPDIFQVNHLDMEIERGLIADLSIFADYEVTQIFNPDVLELFQVHGRQFGIPLGIAPWGVWVNRSLALENNIDIPSPNWTMEEYMNFVSNSSRNEWYGATQANVYILYSGTRDFHWLLRHRDQDDPFVRFNSDATRHMLSYLPRMANHSIWPQYAIGNVSAEFMDSFGRSGWRAFAEGFMLTHITDPWNLRSAGNPEHANRVQVADWDIFPRPSTDYVDNHIGVFLDPLAIRNMAMDDGNPELNDEEYAQLRLAYEFMTFFRGDVDAWRAQAQFQYSPARNSALDNTFPVVRPGPVFDEMMDIWFAIPERQHFGDPNLMPGFAAVVDLWRDGQFWQPWHNFPLHIEIEGTRRRIEEEFISKRDPNLVGADQNDPNWLEMVYVRLPEWDELTNERWELRFEQLAEAIERFYPVQTPRN